MKPRFLVALAVLSLPAQAHAQAMPGMDMGHAAMEMPEPGQHAAMGQAAMRDRMTSPDLCSPDEHYLFGMSMCLPRPGAGRMLMAMADLRLVASALQGPRGRSGLASPNWLMVDAGTDLGGHQRLSVDAMLTAERWTFPPRGYPLLGQIGEEDAQGRRYLDAQHPHSSPLMNLTLADTIALGSKSLLRLSFSPRGETTDGPIAFMHRPTGAVNPDAPLGHHIGQDVGHITSTVVATTLDLGTTVLEASAFHGREPEPSRVDLPLGALDSWAVRAIQHLGPRWTAAASFAWVTRPESQGAVPRLFRLSASAYARFAPGPTWRAHVAAIWGGVIHYDGQDFLNSVTLEGLAQHGRDALWTRLEALQRTGSELQIPGNANTTRWIAAGTLGYTRTLVAAGPVDLGLGASVGAAWLPEPFAGEYGGRVPATARLFLEGRWTQMWPATHGMQ